MMRGILSIILAAVFFILSGCAANRQARLPGLPELADGGAISGEDRYRLAQDHFIMARDYERRGINDMALRFYEVAYEFLPSSGYLRKTLTDKYIQSEDYGKALALFEGVTLSDMIPEEKRSISLLYMKLGELEKAVDALESLGGEKNEEEMYSLALLYEVMGRKDKSLDCFRQFFGGGGGRDMVGVGVRLVQFNIGERKFADAESLAVILRGYFPDNAEVVSILGTVRYLCRDTLAAVAFFGDALALDSLNEEALRTLAHINVARGQYGEAVSLYRRLTAQGSAGAVYRRGLAYMLFHAKEYEEAERLLGILIGERGSDDLSGVQELHLYRALVYSHTGRRDAAAEEFAAAIAAGPGYEDAWKELCYMYIIAKDSEKALAAAERYRAAFPESGAGWRFGGYALNIAERRDEAVEALRKAVKADPADHYAWFELGSTLEKMKRIDESACAFKKVLAIRPGDAPASNYLGYMWADANMMLDSAKVLIENALEKDPKNGAYLDSYAWVFYRLGDYEKAHAYLKEALANMEDDDPVLYEHLGDVLFKLNDYGAAEKAYKRSLDLKSEEAARIRERLAEIKNIMRKKGR